ncbi:MAG: hypothetical protein ABW171_07140 [Steroidobacter sp.]
MANRLTLKHIRNAFESGDLGTIAALSPGNDLYKRASARELEEIAGAAVKAWVWILRCDRQQWQNHEIAITSDEEDRPLRGDEAVALALFVVTNHYSAIAENIIRKIGLGSKAPTPGIDIELLNEIEPLIPQTEESPLDRALQYTYSFFFCLWGSYVLCLLHHGGERNALTAELESTIHERVNYLLQTLSTAPDESIEWALKWSLTRDCFDVLCLAYSIKHNRRTVGKAPAGYFDVDTHELTSLAWRDQYASGKYEPRAIDRQFEIQLSLLMQSFGFRVLGAAPGERTIDLLCIPDRPSDTGVLLIDAKTSTDAYQLTTSDERALKEYCVQISSSVTILPRVTDLLIVGPAAAPSLAERLRRLETELGITVRFCSAEALATLRKKLLGNLDQHAFFKALRASPHIVTHEALDSLISRENEKDDTLKAAVKAFRGKV